MNENVDVVAVSLEDSSVLWVMENKAPDSAEGCISMAVYRQGCEDRYFTTAPLGKFKRGEKYDPEATR